MKTFQPPQAARGGLASTPSAAEAEAASSNAAVQDQLRQAQGHRWEDDLLAIVQAHPRTPAPAPAEAAAPSSNTAQVWRTLFPSLEDVSDEALNGMHAPVIDGPSLDEQARWDEEWRQRPEFQSAASDRATAEPAPRESFSGMWDRMFPRGS